MLGAYRIRNCFFAIPWATVEENTRALGQQDIALLKLYVFFTLQFLACLLLGEVPAFIEM
jgi:hypothetical protein